MTWASIAIFPSPPRKPALSATSSALRLPSITPASSCAVTSADVGAAMPGVCWLLGRELEQRVGRVAKLRERRGELLRRRVPRDGEPANLAVNRLQQARCAVHVLDHSDYRTSGPPRLNEERHSLLGVLLVERRWVNLRHEPLR